MGDVKRLPAQHPKHPHCQQCGGELPAFNSVVLDIATAEMGSTELLGVTFRVKCRCGAEWDLTKSLKVK
jgi:hypothetical protein